MTWSMHTPWANGDVVFDPIRALRRRIIHIREHAPGDESIFLSAVFQDGVRRDIAGKMVRGVLKLAAAALEYPTTRGIPIDRVDTHSLWIGGANALSLAGYSDRELQKLGRWRGETFKEYVR